MDSFRRPTKFRRTRRARRRTRVARPLLTLTLNTAFSSGSFAPFESATTTTRDSAADMTVRQINVGTQITDVLELDYLCVRSIFFFFTILFLPSFRTLYPTDILTKRFARETR